MDRKHAGFWIRFLANLSDGILLYIGVYLLAAIFSLGMSDANTLTTIVDALYFILLPIVWYGYTLGKKGCQICIFRMDGKKVGIRTMLLRYVVGFVIIYGFTFGIALIVSIFMVIFREDKRAIHDFVAGTYVAYDNKWESVSDRWSLDAKEA